MVDSSPEPSFFKTVLGGKAHREVKVSDAFAACFTHSPLFRAQVLGLLSKTCRVRARAGQPWHCHREVVWRKYGRPDIEISAESGCRPVFVLENKVDAVLTTAQLNQYRRYAADKHLIALTKHPPEVGLRWLQHHRCYALRWQAFHRALTRVLNLARGADRFLCESFVRYLEELGMAHREDVRSADLALLAKTLRIVAGKEKDYIKPGAAFDTGSSCVGILDDVLEEAYALRPKLERVSLWGPTYYKWHEENGAAYHYLRFDFHMHGWKRWWGAGLMLPQAGDAPFRWEVGAQVPAWADERVRSHPLSAVLTRDDVLDPAKMARLFVRDCETWQVM